MTRQFKHARAESYRLLAACFYPPDDVWFTQETFFDALIEALTAIAPNAADYALHMKQLIAQADQQTLAIEYARLFVGPYELAAPPYGSVYLDEGRRVMGDSTMALIEMYREYGLKITDDFKDMPDHIAVELEFMYYLIYKELEAEQRIEPEKVLLFCEAQERFLMNFLKEFIPPFCETITTETTNAFYQALAECLFTFIMHDQTALREEKQRRYAST
jgi:TorA maturation chaperone TorD